MTSYSGGDHPMSTINTCCSHQFYSGLTRQNVSLAFEVVFKGVYWNEILDLYLRECMTRNSVIAYIFKGSLPVSLPCYCHDRHVLYHKHGWT